MADTDPLNYRQRRHPDLDVLSHGLTLWDLDREFPVGGFDGQERMKLRDVLGVLRDSYCRTVGVEYMHIIDPEQRAWLQERIEVPHEKPAVDEQKYILAKLNAAEAFETFLQTKYVGQKRFSLEGGETVIPLLDAVLDKAAEHGWTRSSSAWRTAAGSTCWPTSSASRTRRSSASSRATSTPARPTAPATSSTTWAPRASTSGCSATARPPSRWPPTRRHLEAVDPVLEGIVRAKQDLLDLGEERLHRACRSLLHGDAAFAGPGRGRRDAEPLAAARLPHRRHRARHHQQPGRVHHRPGGIRGPASTAPTSRR